jgi:hypothetical protein
MVTSESRLSFWWPPSRDLILFLVGLAGVAHETIISASPDPTLLLIFGAMLGLPAFLRKDEAKDPPK